MSFRSRRDGSHYPVKGSLYSHPPRSRTYSREIHYDSLSDAHHSVAFADRRWSELKGHRSDRVHLLQAMNEAANRAKVSKGEDSEEHRALRKWVDEHKGKESAHPKADPTLRFTDTEYASSDKRKQVRRLQNAGYYGAADALANTNLNVGMHSDTFQIIQNGKNVEVRGFRDGSDQAYTIYNP